MKQLVWKGVLLVLFAGMIMCLSGGWFLGAVDEWPLANKLIWAGLACCIGAIAIFPFAIREHNQSYFGVLKKYFF